LEDGRFLGVQVGANELEGEDSVFVYTLKRWEGKDRMITIGGPRTVPFQMDIVVSSGSASP
jgi:hypothetical protein